MAKILVGYTKYLTVGFVLPNGTILELWYNEEEEIFELKKVEYINFKKYWVTNLDLADALIKQMEFIKPKPKKKEDELEALVKELAEEWKK